MSYSWGENLWDHPDPLTLSFSSRSVLNTCARKFEFSKMYKDTPYSEGVASEVGKAIHEGYAEWLSSGDLDRATWAYMRKYPIQLNADPYDDRSLEAGLATLDALAHNVRLLEYKLVDITCLDGVIRPGTEVEFEIWIDGLLVGGRPVCYHGFIDAIMVNIVTGEFLVVDLKTYRRWGAAPVYEYTFHGQCTPYGLVVQRAAGADIERFEVAYIPAYIDVLEPKINIVPLQKTAQDVQEWAMGLMFDMHNLAKYAELDFFPRREQGCMFYKSPCQFFGICQSRDKEWIQAWLTSEKLKGFQTRTPMVRKPWVRYVLQLGT